MTDGELLEAAAEAMAKLRAWPGEIPEVNTVDRERASAVLEVFRREQGARDEALREARGLLAHIHAVTAWPVHGADSLVIKLNHWTRAYASAPATEKVE